LGRARVPAAKSGGVGQGRGRWAYDDIINDQPVYL
jgi:hypothetical protein